MLSKLASYATNSTSSIDYEKDENGRLVSASTCNCLPEALNDGVEGAVLRLPTKKSGWSVRKGKVDAIDFTSTKTIKVRGISMLGSFSGSATLSGNIQLKETVSKTILLSESFQYTSNGDYAFYDKMFSSPPYASSGVKYTLTVEYYNTASETIWYSNGGKASTSSVCDGEAVNFQFSDSAESTPSWSNVSRGQIPRILFFC